MTSLLQQSTVNMTNNTVKYSQEDDWMWYNLYNSQVETLKDKVYESFFELLNELCLPKDHVPQLHEVSKVLREKSGWTITRVDNLIPYNDFFNLLANKVFPSTTYIRVSGEFSKDPDIFHELFGHCPMLLNARYSTFINNVAKFALQCNRLEQMLLQRFLWYTIEVGLISTDQGLRVYGGALVSSPKESIYSLVSNTPERKKLDLLDVFRTPYRADVLQGTYFFVNSFDDLYNEYISLQRISDLARVAQQLGEHKAKFEVEYNKYTSVHVL